MVFVQEQQVPAEMERDALDPQCVHVIARTADGIAIGTGRLTPDHKIGRMAVLREWRGKGVGDAMLLALIEQARERGWREVALNAQASAITFYARHGFLPHGERFMEAGIEHLAMRRLLAGANAIEDHAAAVATTTALIGAARRGLWIYSRDLDPGLFDAPEVLDALRSFAHRRCRRRSAHPAAGCRRAAARACTAAGAGAAAAQRVPVPRTHRSGRPRLPVGLLANDNGGYYFRSLGHRLEGEADLHGPGRARQLRNAFEQVWERSRPVTEYRALGI